MCAKVASANYTAANTNFSIPGADSDTFDRADLSTLGQAVEEHTHASTRGLQIPTGGIADDAVTNDKLANITRGSIKVGGASNAPTDLDAKTSGRILVGDGTDILSVAVSGDATLASSGALTIANDAVNNDKLANMTRGTVKVGGTGNAPTDLNAKTSGQILVGDGTDLVSVAVSGDATLAASGALTIANGAITSAKMAATAWTTFTPTLTQAVAVTLTVTYAAYQVFGKTALVQMYLVATSTGTTGQAIVIGSIPAAIAPKRTGTYRICGSGIYRHESGSATFPVLVEATSASTMNLLRTDGQPTNYMGADPSLTIVNGNYISVNLSYEIA